MTTKRLREPLTPKTCPECKQTFDIYRWDTIFCSAKCRKRRERWLKEVDKHYKEALVLIDKLAKYHNTSKDDEAFKAIKHIQKKCADKLEWWD